jgi:adenylate cyclase
MGSRRDRMHKKLQGIFGEEFPGIDDANSRQGSETSSLQGGGSLASFLPNVLARGRNNSMNDALRRSRPGSPSLVSRPRTPAPAPSSEVTPWEFQDATVCDPL